MRAVIQRVSAAKVEVATEVTGEISQGFLILLGISPQDGQAELTYLTEKIAHLRVFEDEAGKMNLSLLDIGGEALVVSQFTLYADTRRGRRPGFSNAAAPELAEPLYLQFCQQLRTLGISVATGRFGAMMNVSLINHGPVTIIIDTDQR